MDAYYASRKSIVLGMALAGMLCGCVFNPYIRTASVPLSGTDGKYCKDWIGGAVDSGKDAKAYADCTRRVMEDKAGRYAVMNNGGAALLLNVAGLAAYRGFRGGHEANVAALTTGGAALYGTQQYLYRKPREAIYWSGAAAIGCAIGIADRRLLIDGQKERLRDKHEDIKAAYPPLESVSSDEVRLRAIAKPNAGCGKALQDEWKKWAELADEIRKSGSVDELRRREQLTGQRIQRLESAALYANVDLVAATNAIRDTVNRQLAMEQPDPAELAKLLSGLKLPALAGSAAPPPAVDEPEAANLKAAFFISARKAQRKAPQCNVNSADLGMYAGAVEAFRKAHGDKLHDLQDLEADLSALEANSGQAPDTGDMHKLCIVSRSAALTPFVLQLPQEGAQKVTQDKSILIPISGGVAPYSAVPASSLESGSLVATAEAADDGEFRFKVAASDTAEVGTHAMIANDATGVTRVFQVEVVRKK